MAIRPIDVRRKEFKAGFRGYDANQVDDFLDQVADEFERAYTDNQRMKDEISGLRERLSQFEDLEGSIRSALVHAEQAANDLRHSAQREADDTRHSAERDAESLRTSSQKEAELTIQEAQSRAHQMLSDSSGRVDRVQESYEALQEAKREFTNDFRQLLRTYMDVMEDMEISTAKGIESSLRQRLDTESINVAREASSSSQPTLTDSGEADRDDSPGPLYDEESAATQVRDADEQTSGGVPEETPAPRADETQRIDLSELPDRELDRDVSEATHPEASEPEYEPSTARAEDNGHNGFAPAESDTRDEVPTQTSQSADSAAAEEVDREEPAFDSGSRDDRDDRTRAEDEFFGSRDSGESERESCSAGQEQEDNRIFRASRFLRRRG